ncbi:hypothetical protein BDR26DRAFT_851652 [Obelidium mucronatum]|nr:hypothetical protein BDR26DRAFT_851652 [Obelidium mucronatum]
MDVEPATQLQANMTSHQDEIVKVSSLGSAGFMSLVNRRIDGEDIVQMTRVMKGNPRDEFIGYLEILSMNGQVMCNCGKTAQIKTDDDGMKTMIGLECTGPTACLFLIGNSSSSKTHSSTVENHRAPISGKSNNPKASSAPRQTNPKPTTTAKSSAPPKKDIKQADQLHWIHRPQPATIVTKTGLYVTITDSPLRPSTETLKPKRPTKTKPEKQQIAKNAVNIGIKPVNRTFEPSLNGPPANIYNNIPQADLNSMNFLHSFESKMFDLGFNSFSQLLDFGTMQATNNQQNVSDSILDALDLDSFFEASCQPIAGNGDGLNSLSQEGHDLVEILNQPINMADYINASAALNGVNANGFVGSDPMLANDNSPFPQTYSDSTLSRQNSFPFCNMFGSDSMLTASSSMDLLSGESMLDNIMTSCELDSLDGSISSIPIESSMDDTSTLFLQPNYLNSSNLQFYHPQNNVAAWLPNLPLPDKNFSEIRLSSSLSSVSSLATTCSTVSNASTAVLQPPDTTTLKPSRKRQHPASTISASSNNISTNLFKLSIPDDAAIHQHTAHQKTTSRTPASRNTSTRQLPPTSRSKIITAPKLMPPPSTTRSTTNISSTLNRRTRPTPIHTAAAAAAARSSTTKTAFGSTIHSPVVAAAANGGTSSRHTIGRSCTPRKQYLTQEIASRNRGSLQHSKSTSAAVAAPATASLMDDSAASGSSLFGSEPHVTLAFGNDLAIVGQQAPQHQQMRQQPTRIPTPVSSLSSMIQQHQLQQQQQQQQHHEQQQQQQQHQQQMIPLDDDFDILGEILMEEGIAPPPSPPPPANVPGAATSATRKDLFLTTNFSGTVDYSENMMFGGGAGSGGDSESSPIRYHADVIMGEAAADLVEGPLVAPAAIGGDGDIYDWLF